MANDEDKGITVERHEVVVTGYDRDAAQALITGVQREVERIARKAGVPGAMMGRALRAFARHLTPHAGRSATQHSPRHYKRWWQGFAAGLRAQADAIDASVHLPEDPFPAPCARPPIGWSCSREHGHDGPCAARPVAIPQPGDTRVSPPYTHQLAHEDATFMRAVQGIMDAVGETYGNGEVRGFEMRVGRAPSGRWVANATWSEPAATGGLGKTIP